MKPGTMDIKIREALSTDADIIIYFQQLMARETEGLELNYDIISAGVRAVFDDPAKGTYYVAEENGAVVGSFLITPEWSDWRNCYIWWFQSVYVLPEYRRKGVFRLMYQTTRELASSKGAGGLRLYVETENSRAMKTYEAMGMNGDHYRLYEWLRR